MSSFFAEDFNTLLSEYVSSYKEKALDENNEHTLYIGSETIGEIVEKLIILNIRIWILEDYAAEMKKVEDMVSYSSLKQKLDICFKVKRPILVEALNKMMRASVIGEEKFYTDQNVKLYKNE